MILVTDYYNTMYARGITKQALIAENYLMCNFALQDVGQFIRNLFPRYHNFLWKLMTVPRSFLFARLGKLYVPARGYSSSILRSGQAPRHSITGLGNTGHQQLHDLQEQ